jgi:predicted outer membrane repeat protein
VLNQENNADITLCTGTITITSEIFVSQSGITLRCQGSQGACTLSKLGSGRIMTFNKGSITIDSIVFTNGNVSGNGGALVLNGSSNNIVRCEFNSNTASGGRGGAVYASSGANFLITSGAGNAAAQCTDAYSSGNCVNFT